MQQNTEGGSAFFRLDVCFFGNSLRILPWHEITVIHHCCHPQGARNALRPRGAFSVLCLGGARQSMCGTMFDVSKGAVLGGVSLGGFRWVFPKIVVPQNGWSIMENPY